MANMRRFLDEIEERLNCLEITSSEPDDIQNQLDQCMVIVHMNFFFAAYHKLNASAPTTIEAISSPHICVILVFVGWQSRVFVASIRKGHFELER